MTAVMRPIIFVVIFLLFDFTSSAQIGSLDNTFGLNGRVVTAFGTSVDEARAIAIQPDGKIVVAGFSKSADRHDVAISRYNTNGTLDNTFDGDGKVITQLSVNYDDEATAVAILPDGKILVGGYCWNFLDNDFALIRYNSNGSLDTAFGSGGKVITPVGANADFLESVAIQTDGKIIAAGYIYTASKHEFAVVRFNANGTLDNTFDNDGKVTIAFQPGTTSDKAFDVALQPDQKIILAGISNTGSNGSFALARFNTNGSLDHTFDNDGKVTTTFNTITCGANAIALQGDGKIVAGGYSFNPTNSNSDFAVVRYNANGTLDQSFGNDGKVTTSLTTSSLGSQIHDIGINADGKIIAVGSTYLSNYDFAVTRFNLNGSLDNSFDTDGKATVDFGGQDYAYASEINASRIYAAGLSHLATGNQDFALAGLNNNSIITNISRVNVTTRRLYIYPNPTIDKFFFKKLSSNDALLTIFAASGLVMQTFIVKGPVGTIIPVNLNELPRGTYFLQLEDRSGKLHQSAIKY